MRDRDTTVRSRELGEGLRRAMERAQMTGQDAARALGWSQSRVSRVLSGKRGGDDEVEISAFLAVCGVTGAERKRLLGLCHEVGKPGWLQRHGARLPHEASSSRSSCTSSRCVCPWGTAR